MSCFPPPPDKESFERELQDIFDRSDNDTLARYLKVTPGYVSRLLSPVTTDESIQYRQIWWQWATDCLSLEKGDLMHALLRRDYLARRVGRVSVINSALATSNIGKQFMEFVEAELNNLPVDVQLKELEDIERAVEQKKQSLLNRKAQQFS